MVMRLATRIVCVIVGLFFVFMGTLTPMNHPLQLWPFFIGIPLVVLGILSIRKWKKENKKS